MDGKVEGVVKGVNGPVRRRVRAFVPSPTALRRPQAASAVGQPSRYRFIDIIPAVTLVHERNIRTAGR